MITDYTNLQSINTASADGDLFIADKISDGTPAVIKVNKSQTTEKVARFNRENDILHVLSPHQNIIKPYSKVLVHDFNNINRDYYIMEKLELNFHQWLYKPESDVYATKIEAFKQICIGLKHAHDHGYIHRDLHFENVLMNTQPSLQLKLIDFGRAYNINEPLILTEDGKIAWGGLVMPPEIRFGVIDVVSTDDYYRGDIYALGIIWMLLITSDTLFIQKIADTIYEINEMIARHMGDPDSKTLYMSQESFDIKYGLYTNWLKLNAAQLADIAQIEIIDDSTSRKLTEFSSKLLGFDYAQRYQNLDSVLKDLEAL